MFHLFPFIIDDSGYTLLLLTCFKFLGTSGATIDVLFLLVVWLIERLETRPFLQQVLMIDGIPVTGHDWVQRVRSLDAPSDGWRIGCRRPPRGNKQQLRWRPISCDRCWMRRWGMDGRVPTVVFVHGKYVQKYRGGTKHFNQRNDIQSQS